MSILLNKLPSFWSGFTNGLRHMIDSLDLVGIYNTIRIVETNRFISKGVDSHKDWVYLTKHGGRSNNSKSSRSSHSSDKGQQFYPKGKPFKAKGKPTHSHP